MRRNFRPIWLRSSHRDGISLAALPKSVGQRAAGLGPILKYLWIPSLVKKKKKTKQLRLGLCWASSGFYGLCQTVMAPMCFFSTMKFLHSHVACPLWLQRRRRWGVSMDTVCKLSYLEGRECWEASRFWISAVKPSTLLLRRRSHPSTARLWVRLDSALYGLCTAACCILLVWQSRSISIVRVKQKKRVDLE